CGQCPPCTVGTARLAQALRAIEAGAARPADLDALAETAGFMSVHGYCAHCRTAAAAVPGLLARFRDDVAAHLEARACPRGGAPAGGAYRALLVAGAVALVGAVVYNRAWHFSWRAIRPPLLAMSLAAGIATMVLSASPEAPLCSVLADLSSILLLGAAASAMV